MELFQTDDHYIIYDNEFSLWCSRKDGSLEPRAGSDVATAWNPVCLGLVYGVIGKIQIHRDRDWRLLLITGRRLVGTIYKSHEVFCINSIAILPLTQNGHPEIDIEKCPHHHFGMKKTKLIMTPSDGGQKPLTKTLNAIKSATQSKKKEIKEKEKHERRVLDELHRMFSDSDCFYYSPTGDLTNTLQRLHSPINEKKGLDQRFFWNQHMLHDIFQFESSTLSSHWIVPVIQGCVQIRECSISDPAGDGHLPGDGNDAKTTIKLAIISRRSKHRAGTRYRRRGIDESGACANFVETEQILQAAEHAISHVQVRGSVPVYWTQPGIKYRPPPRIEREDPETQEAFKKHFEELIDFYRKVAVVTLLEQEGREEGLGDAFMKHVVLYNNPQLTYISFDFHEHCRGLHFENISLLVDSIRHDIIKDQRYCWVDAQGTILEQRGVFRVNCMDCLDRTNVVQTAFARTVLTVQLHKVGLLLPDESLPRNMKDVFRDMWANNGDILSRSYTGTAALKGDYTRTGERKISGMMKDGYHSANRYLTAQFKDAYRQLTVDILLGNEDTPEEKSLLANRLTGEAVDQTDYIGVWTKEREESVQQLIQHCMRVLVPKQESKVYLGGWALISCDASESVDSEEGVEEDDDIILIVTEEAYYVANYDDANEKITQYERISMRDMEAITIGSATTFFGSSRQRCCRIHHTFCEDSGYFITLKDLPGHSKKQIDDTLQGVIHAFAIARAANNLGLKVVEGTIDRIFSKVSQNIIRLTSQKRISMWFQEKLTRDKEPARKSHPVTNHNRHPAIDDLQPKPQRAQQVGKYIQMVGSRVSGLNLLKKIRFGKGSGGSSVDGVENSAFEGPTEGTSEDDEAPGREAGDASSSTVTSSMSVGEYIDICCNIDEENDFDSSLVRDGDINIPRVGDLATDPERNRRSFIHRGVTPKKRRSLFDYGTPEKGLERLRQKEERDRGRGRSYTVNPEEEPPPENEMSETSFIDRKAVAPIDGTDVGSPLAKIRSKPAPSFSLTLENLDAAGVGGENSRPQSPPNFADGKSQSLSVAEDVPLRSPVKSHSANNLLELNDLKGANLTKLNETSDGSDVSSSGTGFRKLTNQFRKFNLPINFTRTQRQNEKLKKTLEMRCQCQSRFISL